MGLLDKLITGTYKNQPRRRLFPQTRGEVFAEMFRYRKRMLVNISLLCALFALPAIVCAYFGLLYKGILPELIEEGSVALPVEGNYDLSLIILNFQMNNLLSLIGFATNALLFLGLGGGVRVMQLLAWGEPVEFLHDFGKGVRDNWKYYLGYSVLFSLAVLFFTFVTGYYLTADTYTAVKAFSIAIAVLVLFFASGTLVFALPHANLYELSFFGTLRNAFLLFIASFPKNLLYLILTVLPMLLFLIPVIAVQTIVTVLFLFIYPAYILLIWVLRSNTLFDRFLNVGENAYAANRGLGGDEDSGQEDVAAAEPERECGAAGETKSKGHKEEKQ